MSEEIKVSILDYKPFRMSDEFLKKLSEIPSGNSNEVYSKIVSYYHHNGKRLERLAYDAKRLIEYREFDEKEDAERKKAAEKQFKKMIKISEKFQIMLMERANDYNSLLRSYDNRYFSKENSTVFDTLLDIAGPANDIEICETLHETFEAPLQNYLFILNKYLKKIQENKHIGAPKKLNYLSQFIGEIIQMYEFAVDDTFTLDEYRDEGKTPIATTAGHQFVEQAVSIIDSTRRPIIKTIGGDTIKNLNDCPEYTRNEIFSACKTALKAYKKKAKEPPPFNSSAFIRKLPNPSVTYNRQPQTSEVIDGKTTTSIISR